MKEIKYKKKSDGIIRTEFLNGQGLGNQLWVYATGRAIAEKNNRVHVVAGYENFLGHDFIEIDVGVDINPNAKVQIFNEAVYYDDNLKFFSSSYDHSIEEIPERVQLKGLFQSERYFYEMADDLPKWIRYSDSLLNEATKYSDSYILNLRGGEYKRHKNLILPMEYWHKSIKYIGDRCSVASKEIIVVTDDERYARALFPHNEIVSGDIMRCYAALVGCKGAIVSNSSFAYFPLKCRQDKPIVVAAACWSRYGNDLNRWAMPANYYSDWLYMGSDGKVMDQKCAKQLADKTADFYKHQYKVFVSTEFITTLTKGGKVKIPQSLKQILKNFLAILFPKHIG